MLAFIVGFIVAFITAIPVAGPISALVFSQGMRGKIVLGRAIALGAALSEAVYAFLAFWGLSRIAPSSPGIFRVSNLIAAVILTALGVYFYRSKKLRQPGTSNHADPARRVRAFLLGAGIAGMNFSLFATWAALIGTLYSTNWLEFSTVNAAFFGVGVAAGILTWFVLFLELIRKYRDRLPMGALDKFLKGFGVLLIGISLIMVFRLLKH